MGYDTSCKFVRSMSYNAIEYHKTRLRIYTIYIFIIAKITYIATEVSCYNEECEGIVVGKITQDLLALGFYIY
jgi:hypothetical protein